MEGALFLKENPLLFPATLAVFVAVIGIFKQRQTARDKNSIDFESSLELSGDYEESWEVFHVAAANRLDAPLEAFADIEKYGTREDKAIRYILNWWERGANGIERKIYDDSYLYDSYKTHVLTIQTLLSPYIKVVQQRAPSAYEKFNKMALKWRQRRDAEKR